MELKDLKYSINKKLTDDQKAVVMSDKDVIVSAAAGSGKTTTMKERVKRLLLDNHDVKLKNMLVLVYNTAAAEKLRIDLHEELYNEIKRTGGGSASNHLREQLDDLPLCHISTIHAYCQFLIQQHFDLLEISPEFEVLDESAHAEYMNKALDFAFEEVAKRDDGNEKCGASFFNLNKVFAQGRKDDSFKNLIVTLFKAIDVQSDKDKFKNDVLSRYADFDNSTYLKIILQNEKETLEKAIDFLGDSKYRKFKDNGEDKFAKKVADVRAILQNALNEIKLDGSKTYADCATGLRASTQNVVYQSATKGSCGEEYKYLADEVNPILNYYINNTSGKFVEWGKTFADMTALKVAHDQNLAFVEKLFEIAEAFGEKLAELKKADKVLAFEDLQHYAVQLLHTDGFEIPKYDAVLVDEYQDVNPTQESLIRAIESVNPSKCCFVGDVKQSIYGFRLADPSIFLKRFEEYVAGDSQFATTFKSNFRSAKNILKYVNLIFNVVMTEESADVEYETDGAFDLGTKNFGGIVETHLFYDDTSEIKAAEKKALKEQGITPEKPIEPAQSVSKIYDIENAKIKEKNLDALDAEAIFVADKIREIVNNAKTEGRYVSYDDIVILARYWRDFKKVKEYLKKAGIPFEETDVSSDNSRPEKDIMMFLNSIDNPRQDYAFAGYLLSFFGGYTEQELLTIASVSAAECLYDKFVIFEKKKTSTEEEERLAKKVNNTLAVLKKYRTKASFKSVRELVGGIIADTSYDAYIARKGMASVDAVKSFVASISDKDNESLGRFLRNYTDEIKKSDSKPALESAGRGALEKAFVSLMLAIDNPSLDNAVEDLAKSKLFGVDATDVMLAKAGNGATLIDNLAGYKSSDEKGQEKIDKFLSGFEKYKVDCSQSSSAAEFVRGAFDEYRKSVLNNLSGEGADSDEKALFECQPFVDSIPSGLKTANAFVEWYFGENRRGKIKLSTMHGYKGLESEVVFVIRTDEGFSTKDYSGDIAIDAGGGIVALKYFDFFTYLRADTLAKRAAEIVGRKRTLKEEMRLFYVAITRAKSQLYVSAALSKSAMESFGGDFFEGPTSMIDFVGAAIKKNGKLKNYFPRYVALNGLFTPLSDVKKLPVYQDISGASASKFVLGAPDDRIKSLIEESQAFVYPYQTETQLSVKYSVSALDSIGEAEELTPHAYTEEGANIGTIYHKIMQHIDFSIEGEDAVSAAVTKMKAENILTQDELDELGKYSGDYAKRIALCLQSNIMQKAREAEYCFREKPFMMFKAANDLNKELASDEEVLAQGVIDLLIFGEKTIIVDYKYSALESEEMLKKYKKQLELYKKAVESAFSESKDPRCAGRQVDEIGLYSFIKNTYIPL